MTSQWLLRGPESEEVLILHQGYHIRAKPKGAPWQNRTFPSPDEAGLAVAMWLEDLTSKGWAVVAEGMEAKLEVLWHEITKLEDGWLTLTVTEAALEVAGGIASRVAAAAPTGLQLTSRAYRHDLEPIVESLAAQAPAGIESLVVDTPDQPLSRQTHFLWGDLAPLLSSMPDLARVYAVGDLDLSHLESESLRELIVFADPLAPAVIEALALANCPRLERLVLGLANESAADPGASAALEDVFASAPLPALRHVEIYGFDRPAALLEGLAEGPLLGQLATLRIAGELEDEDQSVPSLLRIADRCGHLESMTLGIDVLSAEGVAELEKALPRLIDDSTEPDSRDPEAYLAWAPPVGADEASS